MPLLLAPLNIEVRVMKINADEKTRKHLESLGILLNSKLTVISETFGNLIVISKGVRIGLNKDISSKIFVAR